MKKVKNILLVVAFTFSLIISISGLLIFILIENIISFSFGIATFFLGFIVTTIIMILIIRERRLSKPRKANEITYVLLKNKINNHNFIEKIDKTIYFDPDLSLKQKVIKLLKIGMKPKQIPLLFDLEKHQIEELEQSLVGEIAEKNLSFEFELREETREFISNNIKKQKTKKKLLAPVMQVTQKGVNFLKSAFNFQLTDDERKADLKKAMRYFEEALKIDSRFLLAHFGMIQVYIILLQPNLAHEWEAKAVMFDSMEYTIQNIKLTKMIMGRKKED